MFDKIHHIKVKVERLKVKGERLKVKVERLKVKVEGEIEGNPRLAVAARECHPGAD